MATEKGKQEVDPVEALVVAEIAQRRENNASLDPDTIADAILPRILGGVTILGPHTEAIIGAAREGLHQLVWDLLGWRRDEDDDESTSAVSRPRN